MSRYTMQLAASPMIETDSALDSVSETLRAARRALDPVVLVEEEEAQELVEKKRTVVDIGDGYYVHKTGMDANGNHSVWVSKGSGPVSKIQTNGNAPAAHGKNPHELGTDRRAQMQVKDYHRKYIDKSKKESVGVNVDDVTRMARKASLTREVVGLMAHPGSNSIDDVVYTHADIAAKTQQGMRCVGKWVGGKLKEDVSRDGFKYDTEPKPTLQGVKSGKKLREAVESGALLSPATRKRIEEFGADNLCYGDSCYDEDDPETCPACGGDSTSLGVLGSKHHYRCRQCGLDFSTNVSDDHDDPNPEAWSGGFARNH